MLLQRLSPVLATITDLSAKVNLKCESVSTSGLCGPGIVRTDCCSVTVRLKGSVHHVQVQDVGGIVERLLGFLEMGRDHVTAETLIQVRNDERADE